MKEKLTNNWVLKVIALGLATLMWLGVVNMTDPVIVKTINNIPIEVRNAEVMAQDGRTYRLETSGTVAVSVRQTQWDQITAKDITLYVDMNEWYPGTGTLPVHMQLNNSLIKESSCTLRTTVAKVSTDTLETLELPVTVVLSGKPQEGYSVVETGVSPTVVTVEGPSKNLEKLAQAVVTVDVSGHAASLETMGDIVLYDKNGDQVSLKEQNFTLSVGKAKVRVEIMKSVSLPIVLGEIQGVPAAGYRFGGAQLSLLRAAVVGRQDVLSQLTAIRIESPELTVAGAGADVLVELDLKEYLPDGITLLEGEESLLRVTLKVEKIEQRTFTLTQEELTLIGMQSSLSYQLSYLQPITVVLEGPGAELDRLTAEDLNAQLDVSGLKEGEHEVRLSVRVDSTFTIKETAKVIVVVSKYAEDGAEGRAVSEEEV